MEALNDDKGSTVSLLPSAQTKPAAKNSPTTIKPGTTLSGRFIVVEKIAEGGTSNIYSAIDKLISVSSKSSHPVALKVSKNQSKSVRQLMVNEALVSRSINHQNVATIYSYHRDQGLDYLSMELINGETLANALSRAPDHKLSYSHMLSIIVPTCNALAAMHEQHLIHSDIKPSNILITDKGDIKVIDLATARHSATSSHPPSIHGTSYYGYTLGYASPETIADKPATASDDVFSIGCIVYEMLTGSHPYGRKASNKIKAAPLLERPKSINKLQWALLKKAIHLDGKKRFSSINRFTSLFVKAGKISRYTAIAALLIAVPLGLTSLLGTSTPQWTIEDEQQIANQQIESIKNTNITLMPEALAKLNSDLLDMGSLRLLQKDVTQRTLEHVRSTLRDNQSKKADIASLESLVAKLTTTYPDSMTLNLASSDIQFKKQSIREKAIRDYKTFWATSSFLPSDLIVANQLLDDLSALGIPNNPAASSTNRFEQLVNDAKALYNYKKITEMAVFSDNPSLPMAFSSNIDSTTKEIMLGAKELSSYITGDTQTLSPKAKEHFITPFVNATRLAINNAWSDKDIIAVKTLMNSGIANLHLKEQHKAYKEVNQAFTKKVAFKIDHHRLKGNQRNALQLQSLLNN